VSCRGQRHRALTARGFANETCRWQRSGHRLTTSGTLGDGCFQALTAGEGWRRDGLVGIEGRVKPGWRRASSVGPMEGSNQAVGRHGPLDRWKGVKPSWRRASSVGPTERVRRPAPWLWLVAGCSDPLHVPRIQGTASGQQDDRFRPA
jgi:hypothetical protein